MFTYILRLFCFYCGRHHHHHHHWEVNTTSSKCVAEQTSSYIFYMQQNHHWWCGSHSLLCAYIYVHLLRVLYKSTFTQFALFSVYVSGAIATTLAGFIRRHTKTQPAHNVLFWFRRRMCVCVCVSWTCVSSWWASCAKANLPPYDGKHHNPTSKHHSKAQRPFDFDATVTKPAEAAAAEFQTPRQLRSFATYTTMPATRQRPMRRVISPCLQKYVFDVFGGFDFLLDCRCNCCLCESTTRCCFVGDHVWVRVKWFNWHSMQKFIDWEIIIING